MKYSYKEMPEQMKGTFGDISRSFGVDCQVKLTHFYT